MSACHAGHRMLGPGQLPCEVSDAISAHTCPTQTHSVPILCVTPSSLTLFWASRGMEAHELTMSKALN